MTENPAETRVTPEILKSEQISIVKVFGNRMKEAREIAGFNQIYAAKKLGYANSSGLAKVEVGDYSKSIPWWLIPRASNTYNVTADYLLGFSDEWLRDTAVTQPRDISHFLLDRREGTKYAEMNATRVLNNKLNMLELAVTNAITNARRNNEILIKFRELNPNFDEMKMGARLVRASDESLADASRLMAELNRYHSIPIEKIKDKQ